MRPAPRESWLEVVGNDALDGPRPRGGNTVGTTLTPEFWERFAVLLVAATAVTVVLTAVFDTLVLRLTDRRGRGHRPPAPPEPAAHRPQPVRRHRTGTSVNC